MHEGVRKEGSRVVIGVDTFCESCWNVGAIMWLYTSK